MRQRPGAVPLAARHSIRVRLVLLMCGLVAAAVVVFLSAAYREVEGTLIREGGGRAKAAADQISNLIAASSQQGLEQLHQAAADIRVRRYLDSPTDDNREAASDRLASLAGAGTRRVALWSNTGTRLLEVSPPAAAVPTASPPGLPASASPTAAGFSALQILDGVVFTDTVSEIEAASSTTTQPASPAGRGYLTVRSTLSVNPPGVLGRLVGKDAVIAIGNMTGGLWTDLSKVVPAPPLGASRTGTSAYRDANGDLRLGAVSPIRGTPWAVSVEFPHSMIVAPARLFLGRMSVVALFVVGIAAILVGHLSTRITRPLQELARAADEIAAGDYSRKVAVPGRHEIARLSRAFNAMGEDVKSATDRLRKSEQALAATLASIHEGVAIAEPDGRVVYLNAVAARILGMTRHGTLTPEWTGQYELFFPDEQTPVPSEESPLLRALQGADIRDVDLFVRHPLSPNGTHVSVNAGALLDSDGVSKGAVATFRDISLKRHVDQERARTAEMEQRGLQAQQANRLKSEFLANMSHELRTPLNAIIGFAELMHKGKVGPVSADHEEYLGDILTSASHLLQLINDVLDLAKIESGKMELRPESVDLGILAREVSDIVRGLAASKHVRLDTHIAGAATAVVDPARVKQILYNYLSNAIKFTPERGEVHVRISPEGPDLFRIDVDDTGPGIPAADLTKLFVEFQQLDGAAKQFQGTGLGLALTKRLAEAHGGRVAVRSTPGAGSTFSAILPRVTNAALTTA